jgi:hypothetical protein
VSILKTGDENEGTDSHCELVIGKQLGHECKKVIVVLVESNGNKGEFSQRRLKCRRELSFLVP